MIDFRLNADTSIQTTDELVFFPKGHRFHVIDSEEQCDGRMFWVVDFGDGHIAKLSASALIDIQETEHSYG